MRQHILGTWEDDATIADRIGVSASQITLYKARDDAPPALRTLALARLCDVDPGWLAFGVECAAPAPDGFADWLAKRYPPKPVGKMSRDSLIAIPPSTARRRRKDGS